MANKIYVWKGGQQKTSISEVLSNFDVNDFCFNAPFNWYRLTKNGSQYTINITNQIPSNKDIVVFGNPPIKPGESLVNNRTPAIAPCLFGGWSGDQHTGTFRGGYNGAQALVFNEAGVSENGTTFTSYFSNLIVDSHGILSLFGYDVPTEELPIGQPPGRAKYHLYGYGVSLSQGFTWSSAGPLLGGGLGKNSSDGINFIRDNFPAIFAAGITKDSNNLGGYTGSFFDTQNNSFNNLRIKSNNYEIFNLGYTASAYIDIETVPNLSPFGNTYPSAGYTGPLTGLYSPVIKTVFNASTTRFMKIKNGKFKSMYLTPAFYKYGTNIGSRWSEFIENTSIEYLYSHEYLSEFRGVTLGEANFVTSYGYGFSSVGLSGSNQYRQVTLQGNQNRLNILQEHYPGITATNTNNRGFISIESANYENVDTYLTYTDNNTPTYEKLLVASDCFRDNTNAAIAYSQIFDETSIYGKLATTIADSKYPVFYIGNNTAYDTYSTSNIEYLFVTTPTIHPVMVKVANVNINTAEINNNCVLQITDVGDSNITTKIGETNLSGFGSLDLTQAESNPNHNIYFGIQGVTSISGGISSTPTNKTGVGGIIRTNSNEKLFNVSAKLANTYVGPNDDIIFVSQIPPVTTTKK